MAVLKYQSNEDLNKEETKQNALKELKERLSGDFVMSQTQIPSDVLAKYEALEKNFKKNSTNLTSYSVLSPFLRVCVIIATILYIVLCGILLYALQFNDPIEWFYDTESVIIGIFLSSVFTWIFVEFCIIQYWFTPSLFRTVILFPFGIGLIAILQIYLIIPIPLFAVAGLIGLAVNQSRMHKLNREKKALRACSAFYEESIAPLVGRMLKDLKAQYAPILGEKETVAIIRKRFMARNVGTRFFGEDDKDIIFDDFFEISE